MNELIICRHRPGAGEGATTILTLGQDGTVIGTDPNLSQVLGYTSGDIQGRPLTDLIASAEDNPLCPDYASYHQSGRPLVVTLRHGRGHFMAARVVVHSPAPEVATAMPPGQTTSTTDGDVPRTVRADTERDYRASSSKRETIASTKAMLGHIRECLAGGALPLEYQPIHGLGRNDDGLRIEVLARFPKPEHQGEGLMVPADFLPLVERFELDRRLDRQVIKQVACHLYRNPTATESLSYCGFNLSRGSLQDRTFPAYIARVLEKTGLPAGIFCFEIPSEHAVAYPEDSRHTCRMLQQLGCKTALDGAGISMDSYRLAGRMPVDYIKLAPELMRNLHDEPTHLVMIEALQRIANSSGKSTIATSVENDISRHRAQGMGIHYIQGRVFSNPRALREFGSAEWGPRSAGAIA